MRISSFLLREGLFVLFVAVAACALCSTPAAAQNCLPIPAPPREEDPGEPPSPPPPVPPAPPTPPLVPSPLPPGPPAGLPGAPGLGGSTGTGGVTGASQRPTGPVGRAKQAASQEEWSDWWEANKWDYWKTHLEQAQARTTQDSDRALGNSDDGAVPTAPLVSQAVLQDVILPILQRARHDGHAAHRTAALFAMAKTACAAALPDLWHAVVTEQGVAQQAALLAYGQVGGDDAVDRLALFAGEDAQRAALKLPTSARVSELARQTALLALGLTRSPRARPFLVAALEYRKPETATFAVVGLGLLKDASAVPQLLAIIEDVRAPRTVRHAALSALGQIGLGGGPVLEVLLERLAAADRDLAIGAAATLATLAPPATPELLQALRQAVADNGSGAPSGYALLAFARIAPAEVLAVAAPLAKAGGPTGGYAALALGLSGREVGPAAAEAALLAALKTRGDASTRAAVCVALGLLGEVGEEAQQRLVRIVERERNPDLRAAALTALGMAGVPDGLPLARKSLEKGSPREVQAAGFAVALLQHRSEALQELLPRLPKLRTEAERTGVAALVGLLATPREIPALEAMAMGKDDAPWTGRGAGSIALGALAGQPSLSPLLPLRADGTLHLLGLPRLEQLLYLL